MNELLDQLDFSLSENFSLVTYITNIVIATILLYILSYIYEKQGNSVSNRKQLGRVLILVGVTTFIIISIVKSSLALSLGLVGALSIVRFRTAIKEPEELGFFFVSISIGLGLGANQLAPTIIGFIVIILIVKFLNRGGLSNTFSQNVLISLNTNGKDKNNITSEISKVIEENALQLELKRMSSSKEVLNLNFLVSLSSFQDLQKITLGLEQIDNDIELSFIDNQA
jgi:predicted amino acid-binding ACT domain protein